MTKEEMTLADYEERLKLVREQLRLAIYFAREFIAELGKEKALEIIEKAWVKYGADNWKGRLASVPPGDILKAMGDWFKAQARVRPELKVVKATPRQLCIEFTRCPQYDVCKEAGLPELCQKYCDSDYAVAALLHPKLKMVRDKELAYGAKICNHCWVIEE